MKNHYWACKNDGSEAFVAHFDYTDRNGTSLCYQCANDSGECVSYDHDLVYQAEISNSPIEAERKTLASDKIEGPFDSYHEALEFAQLLS
jgi:hypothetical protein